MLHHFTNAGRISYAHNHFRVLVAYGAHHYYRRNHYLSRQAINYTVPDYVIACAALTQLLSLKLMEGFVSAYTEMP